MTPLDTLTAARSELSVAIGPVVGAKPELMSKTSAVPARPPFTNPPAMRTRPSDSSAATWWERGTTTKPVDVKVEVPSKISPVASIRDPPTMRTLPDDSSVAVWNERAVAIGFVGTNVDVPSEKISE
jgi:hypothetical protein